jgi:hypothetical protein
VPPEHVVALSSSSRGSGSSARPACRMRVGPGDNRLLSVTV